MKSWANISVITSLSLNSGLAPGLPCKSVCPLLIYQSSTNTRMVVRRLTMSILVVIGVLSFDGRSGTSYLGQHSFFVNFDPTSDVQYNAVRQQQVFLGIQNEHQAHHYDESYFVNLLRGQSRKQPAFGIGIGAIQ